MSLLSAILKICCFPCQKWAILLELTPVIFLKNYFVATAKAIDFIPVIHDIRYAVRDSQMTDGLVVVYLPGDDAFLVKISEDTQENLKKNFEKWGSAPQCSSLTLPFQKRELVLEPKQMIYLVDISQTGKRREFVVQVMGEAPQAQQQAGGPKGRPQGGGRR